MVSIVCNAARESGHAPVVVVVPDASSGIIDTLGDSCRYAFQERPLGTGDALLRAQEAIAGHDNVLVLNADIPLIRPHTLKALAEAHIQSGSPVTILTSAAADPTGLGRVVRNSAGRVIRVVEHSEAEEETLRLHEVNAGVYCFQTEWLWDNLSCVPASHLGEVFLTRLIDRAKSTGKDVESMTVSDADEARGVNTRVELSVAESIMRERIRTHWMLNGVSIPDPQSVYIDYDVQIGTDTVLLPNTHILGPTLIGEECEIGPNSIVDSSALGNRVQVVASVVEESTLETEVRVGPFSHIRPGVYLESRVHIGNFGEVKNSRIGRGSRSGHFSYIGDAQVGSNVNIGAGSITCNFDGEHKHETVIGNDAFIGCDTMMVAPVTIGDRAYTSTGSIVNRNVPADSGAIGAPARIRSKKPKPSDTAADGPADLPCSEH